MVTFLKFALALLIAKSVEVLGVKLLDDAATNSSSIVV